jgi:hypothetical protein
LPQYNFIKMAKKRNNVTGTFNGMTFAEWQDSPTHVKWIREQMTQALFRDMLAVLSNLRPSRQPDPVLELGIRLGLDQMLGVILAMAQFPQSDHAPVEATYGADERPVV